MSDEKPIRISGMQAADWGPLTLSIAKDTLRSIIEERTGKTHEWKALCNMDAIELVPVRTEPDREPRALARIDVYDGHTIAQHLPGQRDRLLRELLLLTDTLIRQSPVPLIQVAEVEAVKE